jgi:6-phosphogluconolactonase
MFVSFQKDDLISRFDISRGVPENRVDFSMHGGPAPLAMNPGKTLLFAGMRQSNELVCMKIEKNADLSFVSKAALPSDPCFVSMDHQGRYIFTAYYKAGQIAVHRWDEKSNTITETCRITTEPKAHSIWLAKENSCVYAPHTEPNKIYLYDFDDQAGTLHARTPPYLIPEKHLEPRHLCFHPTLNYLYVLNECSSTVTRYSFDRESGAIQYRETVSTLPAGENGENLCAEIRISPNGRFLYASNRGHDSIACYKIDGKTGLLNMTAIVSAPAAPRSFDISPDGLFLYAAGLDSGELVTFKIDENSGNLKEMSRMFVGNVPMWVMSIVL